MTTLLRRTAVLLAAVTAAAGLALPASAATSAASSTTAAAQVPCPRILAVCAQTAQGELRIIVRDEPVIVPPVVRAVNQTPEPWCFFSAPGFNGDRREVSPWETVEDFGFEVFSARRGACTWS
ncbi:hypothetical protein ACTMTF_20850 [Nonomuraea sp. ZG12]|uniref:hypothetical protein n=1 Tax=Nonomuraea sp. ZG12 TaxID=3452207 RepID=UPI003F892659